MVDSGVDIRNDKGQFVAGHPKTGGRKTRIDEEDKNKLFDKAFPKSKKVAILQKLGSMAERGDLGAIKLVLEYLYGRPIERKEITGADKQPLVIRVVYDEEIIDA